ncbi:MAG: hypothetical protein Kow0042_28280 [Calditrichia bacterium]
MKNRQSQMDSEDRLKTLEEKLTAEKLPYIPVVESLIFSSEVALSGAKIREIVGNLTPGEISLIVQHLNEQYRITGRSFEIREIGGAYQMFTLPEYASYVERIHQSRMKSRLSHKALETMAIIAYKQPITKHEIEEIRGVNVDGVVKTLLSRNLITIAGRAPAPGGPFLYKTTRAFLDYFGLRSLEDLPKLKEIDELVDIPDEDHPYYETFLKEISATELGLKEAGNHNSNENGGEADEQGE